jgi:uncharacterized protein YndB with AHSA1/START domain
VEVTRELVVEAPAEEVWEALTDPDRLEEWFANEVELDAEPGGEGTFRWDNGEVRRAVVEEVETGRRLSFRWRDEVEHGGESRVVFTLTDVPEGTRLVVTEVPEGPTACAGEWGVALELQLIAGRSGVLV